MKLTINDKEYPLQFGIGAIEIYCDKMDCDIEDVDIHIASPKMIQQLKAINTLALCALQNGCEIEGIDFKLTYREFQKWLDTQDQSMAKTIIDEWKKSSTLGVKVSEFYENELLDDDTNTKKVSSKKKSPSAK